MLETANTVKTMKIGDTSFSYTNGEEFQGIHHEIFMSHILRFTAATPAPLILDCGAHIGTGTLYFKKLYPHAKVIAFEPSPDTFKLLELNVKQNNLKDVELVNAALSDAPGEMDFYVCNAPTTSATTWACGFAGVKNTWYDPDHFQTIKVASVRLSSYINQPIDLLKIDIEGMESMLLEEIEEKLYAVKEIKMEFHGDKSNHYNTLEKVIAILERNGFYFVIKQHDMKIVRINQREFVNINQLEENNPYFLFIFASRQRRSLYWHTLMLPQWDRALRAPEKLLAMASHPEKQ